MWPPPTIGVERGVTGGTCSTFSASFAYFISSVPRSSSVLSGLDRQKVTAAPAKPDVGLPAQARMWAALHRRPLEQRRHGGVADGALEPHDRGVSPGGSGRGRRSPSGGAAMRKPDPPTLYAVPHVAARIRSAFAPDRNAGPGLRSHGGAARVGWMVERCF